ncbi:MAG: hypothetical protein IPP71_08590 [Bacteroidetes bacterium]|nr:hypothetical protein [Bacteroidota bacterium]
MSRKETEYFQTIADSSAVQDTLSLREVFEPKIQTNDILLIQVASINPEAARFFNPTDNTGGSTDANLVTYLVGVSGEI